MMTRECDQCGKSFEAKRSTAKYCGSTCRARRATGQPPVKLASSAAVTPLLFAGVLGVGVTYTIQIYAQRFTPASVAALLMSMEAVFSAVGGVIILHEMLSVREWVGCGIMLLTIFYVQLPHREPVKREPVKAA